jgi:hypothetical protein
MRLRPAWIQTSLRSLLRIHAVRLQTLLQVEKLIANSMDPDDRSDCADVQVCLDPCWSQKHYVVFVVTRLIYSLKNINITLKDY